MTARTFWGSRLIVYLTTCLGALTSACLDRPLCSDECKPATTNQYVLRVPTGGIKKIDFLFMIDNSGSMADKQKLLRSAVPSLVSRFVTPLCVDEQGNPNGTSVQDNRCTIGTPQFPAIEDIHIAVISSSLGAGGSTVQCNPADTARNNNDRAQLLPKVRAGLPSWNGSGFLNWDPKGVSQPAGSKDRAQLATDFQNLVAGAGENGCGFEASLESWYRFLIDPDPPAKIEIQGGASTKVGVDTDLLAQRAQFLRPDSLVAIVMLSDENDCSIQIGGSGHILAGPQMPRATSICAQDANNPCCRSCGSTETQPPAGCAPLTEDAECKKGSVLPMDQDQINLRCWDQKRRFGADLLEPTSKYVRGLTQTKVPDRAGVDQPNPLFAGGRATNLVYLAGIVGVPWQDIATDDSLTGQGLKYLTAAELRQKNRWDVILGDPATRKPPSDPHMIELDRPRTGSHPFLPQAALAPPDSTTLSDVINGHEHAGSALGDLEYACIFELETPTNCDTKEICDCKSEDDANAKKPLCQPRTGGPIGRTQFSAKAYPGLRQLEVLHGIGDQAIVASICPKVVRSANPDTDINFGYNPAMDALVRPFIPFLANQCLPRAPEVDEQGHASCVVLEAQLGGTCDCNGGGRSVPDADSLNAVRSDLRGTLCDMPNTVACSDVCACQLTETAGPALDTCRSNTDPNAQSPGYCYIDPDKGLGDPGLVRGCPANKRRMLRFVGENTPRSGSLAYMACMGKALKQ
ncbi:MAG TPA: hypothetical protein VG937_17460 [Polyangiaceae bacterium]|nr:hypothetical protein [Polyangiaceae bacterium]